MNTSGECGRVSVMERGWAPVVRTGLEEHSAVQIGWTLGCVKRALRLDRQCISNSSGD